MPNNFPNIAFSCFRFSYIASDAIVIPAFPGGMLHGAFGNALYKLNQNQDIEASESNSVYKKLFKNEQIINSGSIRNLSNPPAPYVFRYSNQYALNIPPLHQFHIDLLLIGSALEYAKEILMAMQSLGEYGFSQKKAKLYSIEQKTESALTHLIQTPADIKASLMPTIPPQVPKKIRVMFLSPYLANGRLAKTDFDISLWLMGIIRRISLLQNSYSDTVKNNENKIDFSYLKALTQKITVHSAQLYYYQTHQTKHNYTSGLLGTFDISLTAIEALWPWLYIGQWLHGGKKTSYGFGRYKLITIN